MKFIGGYLLGGATVVGLAASFCAGVVACDWMYTKKAETASKISDATVGEMFADFMKNRKN